MRPAPAAAAAVRVRGGAGAALLRVALRRRGAGAGAARRWMRRRRRRCLSSAVGRAPRAHGWRPRPTGAREGVGPSRPARPHRLARRDASNTELAALPAAADWPNLKTL